MATDTTLEAVIYRHDLSRHSVKMKVDGNYAYNDKEQIGMFINPHHHVGEIRVPFKKTLFTLGMGGLLVVPIYIYIMTAVLPTLDLYKVILGITILAVPIGAFFLARMSAPSVMRRIYCIWGEPEPLNLYYLYDWDYDLHWSKVQNLQAVAKNNARFSTMKLTDTSFLTNAVAWVILSFGILIALVIVIGLLRP